MEISKILPSRAIRFTQITSENDPFLPDIIFGIRDRYKFFEYPTCNSDLDMVAGIKFLNGRFKDYNISSFEAYDKGLSVETSAGTIAADEFIDDLLSYLNIQFGFTYKNLKPVVRSYISVLEIQMKGDLKKLTNSFDVIAEFITTEVGLLGLESCRYTTTGVTMHCDLTSVLPIQPRSFAFERRADKSFDENTYFSAAPVSTDRHVELLKILEKLF